MRHRFLRNLFNEILTASRIIKIALIIPFIVLIFDAEIFYYSWTNHEKTILIASGFVLLLSILEIIAVIKEIHEHISSVRRKEILMEKLRQIAENMKKPTVRKIMDTFMEKYGEEYSVNEVYHATCDLLSEFGNK
ncbi:MAG TPA: hypothetical protein ENI52_05345 [Thermoplasmata archaeon]|nr:hypothetical protein [Thermoplasmata archaeon]